MSSNFSQYKIKEYKYWEIYIHQNQNCIGRCYIWCKRENALDLTDAMQEELKEFFEILKKLKNAVSEAFKPDWYNYSFLGNETRHLHAHFIPRYARPIIFKNITFEDKRYGHSHRTDHDFIIPDSVLMEIKKKIEENLK